MSRAMVVLRNVSATLDVGDTINSDVLQIGPEGTNQIKALEHPSRLVCIVGTDQDGTLTVWEGLQRADMPGGGAAVPLRQHPFPYIASPSMQVFVVENIVGPFVQIRYVNGGAQTGEFRLYCVLHFD